MDKNYEILGSRESTKTIRGIKILQSSESSLLKEALEDLYYERSLQNGFCVICNLKTSKLCSNCGTHYCSDDCQKLDWPKHRSICEKKLIIKQLSHSSISESSANESDFEGFGSTSENKWKHPLKRKSNRSLMNREKMSTAHDFRPINHDFRSKNVASNFGSHDKSRLAQNSMSKKNTVKYITKEQHITKNSDSYNQPSENKINGGKTCVNNEKTKEENCESKSFSENEVNNCVIEFFKENELDKLKLVSTKINHLIFGNIIRVKFTFIELHEKESSLYWVIKDDNIPEFEKIQKFFSMECENLKNTLPQKNGVYGCMYEGKWCRGKVISTQPMLQIHSIDTGAVYDYYSKNVKILPPDLESLNGLAFPIELLNSAENINNEIKCLSDAVVEVVGVNSKGIYQVKLYENKHQKYVTNEIEEKNVIEDIQEISTPKVKTVQVRRSVVDDLKEGYCGIFHVMHSCNEKLYGCLIPEDVKDAIDCHRKITNMHTVEMQRIEADPGDLVMVVNDNQGQRGIVSSKSDEKNYEVFLIDYGYTIETFEIFQLPQNISDSMELACKMTIMKSREEILDMQLVFELNIAYMFEIKSKINEDKWHCILKYDPDEEIEMLLEKNEQRSNSIIKYHKENYIPLESECRVIISALGDGNTVYIRRIDGSWEEDLEKMVVNINLWIENEIHEDNLLSSLQVDDLVCAKFQADKIFYRARVLSIIGDKVRVLFVDYGNIQETCMNDLRPLKMEFRNKIIFAQKISLYNPKNKIISESGLKYLKNLIVNSIELIMTFHDGSSDSVILSERDSYFAINEFIFDEEIKIKQEKQSSETSTDILKFPIFSVGEKNLIILHVNDAEFMKDGLFWASDPCLPHFEYIMGELPVEISNYSSLTTSYNPKVGELCFAQFEGGWYRGMVINKRGRKFKIFFIDFGNTCFIEPDLIREKKSELFEKAPAAVKCIFSGFENQDDDQRRSAINFLKKHINEYLNSVVVEKIVNDSCCIRFPSFEAKSNI